jgi:hypothetical protein
MRPPVLSLTMSSVYRMIHLALSCACYCNVGDPHGVQRVREMRQQDETSSVTVPFAVPDAEVCA